MIQLPWLLIQLVAYVTAMVAIVATFAFVALAPPFFAGRYLWQRLHTH